MSPHAAADSRGGATGGPIRVAIVDDSRSQREGWAILLDSQSEFEVVGQAGDGAQALALARREPIDVLLMDIQMPRVNGFVAAGRIAADARVRELGQVPRIVLVTAIDLDAYVPGAAVAGAYAVLYKDVDPEGLFETIREAAAYRGEE
ncbi:MAG: response regulator transcription factor [Actinomycetota bacterium]|nr:response regulator transcription factor [Actinomycetota bacterium]